MEADLISLLVTGFNIMKTKVYKYLKVTKEQPTVYIMTYIFFTLNDTFIVSYNPSLLDI